MKMQFDIQMAHRDESIRLQNSLHMTMKEKKLMQMEKNHELIRKVKSEKAAL